MTTPQLTTQVVFIEIPGAPGYDAGSDGHVYSRRTKGHAHIRSPRLRLAEKIDRDGYRHVTLRDGVGRRTSTVHRLVLLAFKGPCPDGMMACHYPDYDRSNNRPENLVYGTNSTNQLHRREQGTAIPGSKNHKAKFTDEEVAEIRRTYEAGGVTQKDLAAKHGVALSTIARMIHGLTWGGIDQRKTYHDRKGAKKGVKRRTPRRRSAPGGPALF